jgi:hypothetical protein
MTDNDASAIGLDPHVNFDAPAILRKWPSLQNQRRTDGTGPYIIVDATLDECIREFMAKPAPCDTCMRSTPHHNPRLSAPSCPERSSPSSRGYGIFSDLGLPRQSSSMRCSTT